MTAPDAPTNTERLVKTEGWTGKKCPRCNGFGERTYHDGEERSCDGCGGTGEEYGEVTVAIPTNTERCGGEVEALLQQLSGAANDNRFHALAPYLKRAGEIIKGQNTTIVSLSEENRVLANVIRTTEATLDSLNLDPSHVFYRVVEDLIGINRRALSTRKGGG